MTINIGFVLFPNVTQLDFTGPLQVLHRLPDSKTHIVANTREPVPSDCGLGLVPTTTFAECEPLDLVCVPGGYGVSGAIADPATIDFVRRQGTQATYVTSVCTGAFVLGVAGLLRGKRATTHWAYTGLLPRGEGVAYVLLAGYPVRSAGAGSGEDDRADELRIFQRQLEGDVAAHREGDDVRPAPGEDRGRVGGEVVYPVRLVERRGASGAARVVGNRAEVPGESGYLLPPGPHRLAQALDQQLRIAVAGFLDVQL